MAGRGGKRAGAGRKPKREKHKNPVQAAEDRIRDKLPHLIDKLFELSDGIEVVKQTQHGEKSYREPPSFKALEYLCNRVLGKPTERLEHSGKDGGPIEVTATVKNKAARELEEWQKEMRTKMLSSSSVLPTAPTSPTPTG
ncbi:MAG: hypothetical protein P4L84_11055 [Isosphaeraceae bacterium]|nr:hypothetical protein [Isosphaeraceae bacterium]